MTLTDLEKLCAEATPNLHLDLMCSDKDIQFVAAAGKYMPKLIAVARAAAEIPTRGFGSVPNARIMCDDSCSCNWCRFDGALVALEHDEIKFDPSVVNDIIQKHKKAMDELE